MSQFLLLGQGEEKGGRDFPVGREMMPAASAGFSECDSLKIL